MIILIKHRVNWELIRQQKQAQSNRENTRKNKQRVEYDYKVGDKVMLTNNNAQEYETPYKSLFLITKCFTNGRVMLKYDAVQITYKIRFINLYKYDTKVVDFIPKNKDDSVNIRTTSNILLYQIKAWNRVHDQINTEKSDVNAYRPCK